MILKSLPLDTGMGAGGNLGMPNIIGISNTAILARKETILDRISVVRVRAVNLAADFLFK